MDVKKTDRKKRRSCALVPFSFDVKKLFDLIFVAF